MNKVACASVVLCVLIAACFTGADSNDSSSQITLGDTPVCATCTIIAETLAVLPHPDDTLELSTSITPAHDSRGRYYAVDRSTRKTIHVFGSNGRLLRTFGKPGQGPGEISGIRDLEIGIDDSLYVFEPNRVLVFSSGHEYAREFKFPFKHSSVAMNGVTTLAGGRFLIPSDVNSFGLVSIDGTLDSTTASGDARRAEMAASGQRESLFSIPVGIGLEGVDTTTCLQCGQRTYREGVTPGTIWSGSMHQYVVERHDLSGKLLQRIVREASWFPKWPREQNGGHGAAITNAYMIESTRKTRFIGAFESPDQVLWTHCMMQDPKNPVPDDYDFMAELNASINEASGRGSVRSTTPPAETHIITAVEAIDLKDRQLMARQDFAGVVRPMYGGLVAQLYTHNSGDQEFRILRLRINR